MSASSQHGFGYQAAYGRLKGDRGDCWCSQQAARYDDWLQVDLGKSIEACGLATQGDRHGSKWVTAFKLSYSSDGTNWNTYGTDMVRSNFSLIKQNTKMHKRNLEAFCLIAVNKIPNYNCL